MDNVEELMATFSMLIGLVVATFFLNTGRGLQAVMLGEECLNFLKSDKLESKTRFRLIMKIYTLMFQAACMASNHTSAESMPRSFLMCAMPLVTQLKKEK